MYRGDFGEGDDSLRGWRGDEEAGCRCIGTIYARGRLRGWVAVEVREIKGGLVYSGVFYYVALFIGIVEIRGLRF